MDIYEQTELQECPFCGGAALLEEENGWCFYVMCTYCGSQTAEAEYRNPKDRLAAAQSAAYLWNIGKIMRSGTGE